MMNANDPASGRPGSWRSYPALAMTCTVVAFYMLVSSAEFLVWWVPQMKSVHAAVKCELSPLNLAISRFGFVLWFAVALCVFLTFRQVLRKGYQKSTLVVAMTTALASYGMEWMCREAFWGSFDVFFKGIGTNR